MGFNAFTLKRPVNPFRFPSHAAADWLSGFVDAQFSTKKTTKEELT